MAADWHVTSQKLETVPNPDGGGFSQQWNVGYLVHDGPAAGVRGEVHQAAGNLDPEVIHAAIETQVRKHQAVAAL
jgi:hypothetical protein